MAFQVATRQTSRPQQSAVQRVVQRRCQSCADEREREEAGGHHAASSSRAGAHRVSRFPLRAKLHIGEAGDVYEREADRVANTIMGMSGRDASRVAATPAVAPGVQKCAACEAEGRDRHTPGSDARYAASPPTATDGGIEAALASTGRPLSESEREFFEPRFGHDFSHVRVHADGDAAESARAIDALAYTVGSDIVFGAGQYAPASAQGRHLLAHELTHVVQQTAGAGGGNTAQRKLVEQRVAEPSLQARWALDRVTPTHRVDADSHDENGSTEAIAQGGHTLYGAVSTWQTTGFVHQHVGGRAQLAHWVTSHYVFRNDGTTDETLELTAIGQLSGTAKAEDNHYARAGAIVWGGITQRTQADPTPPSRQLFEIHDGGISTGVVNELGEIDVDLPVGENGGSVHVRIPLRYVSEGAQAPFSKAETMVSAVAGSVSEVDLLLGARVSADADIETEFFGVAPWLSRNYNKSHAYGTFDLRWRNRPAPGAVMPPPGGGGGQPAATAAYRCNARCQENCNGEATRYLEGSSGQNCGEATRDAKSKAARGCYPRHCSCRDTEGFRGTGTQCENHRR